MRDLTIPIGGGIGGAGFIYALAQFGVTNLDIMMAALGPFAFRVAPMVPALDEQLIQRIYIALAILSAILAAWTLVRRARKKFT